MEGGRGRRRRRNEGVYIEERTESVIRKRGWTIKKLCVIGSGRTENEEWRLYGKACTCADPQDSRS
jgi:hypothetical protein